MNKLYRRMIIGVLLAASTLAAGWIMQSRRGLKVETAQVLSGPVEDTYTEEGINQNTINSRFYNSQVDQLTAQIQASKTGIRQLEDRISDCLVTAKTDGMITSFPAKNLSVVQAGETLAVINGHQTAMVEADVLTTIAPYIRPGDPVEVVLRLRGKDETFHGTVTEVYDYAEKGISSLGLDEYRVHVKAKLANGETLEGKDGYGVNITFCLFQSEEALSVPSGAVFESDGEHYVFQIRQGRAYKVPVEITCQTGTGTIIASGLQKGDVVIDQVDAEGIYEGAEVRE